MVEATDRDRLIIASRHASTATVTRCVSAGLLTGVLCVILSVSFAGVVFSGPLAPFIAVGIGMALFGTMVHALTIATGSTYPGSVGGASSELAILAVVVASVVALPGLDQTANELLATVVAIVASASLTVGLVCFGLGKARLGNLIRYIPYPVMGGFIAGIGWLLLIGGTGLTLSSSLDAPDFGQMFTPAMLPRWLPALVIATGLLLVQRALRRYFVVPTVLALTAAGFFALAWHNDISVAALRGNGWLLGPLESGQHWSPLMLIELAAHVDGVRLLHALPGIATYTVTLVVGLLLVGSSLEVVAQRDVELNRELRVAGASNLIAALCAGFPGYHYVGCTSLHHHMGADRRISGLLAGVLVGLTYLLGFPLLELIPRIVPATLLYFIGLDLLLTWLGTSLVRLTRSDYLVVLSVFSFVVFVGLMEAVVIGLILGIALFAFSYSRIDVVKKELTAAMLRSRRARTSAAQSELRRLGDAVTVYRLDGFIFFGTVNRLLERIRSRADAEDQPLDTVILDFKNVRGLDSSAAIYFSRLPGLAYRRGFNLVVAGVEASLWRLLEREGLQQERRMGLTGPEVALERRETRAAQPTQRVYMFATLDDALEWAEDRLLAGAGFDATSAHAPIAQDVHWPELTDPDAAQRFKRFAHRKHFDPGQVLTDQGAPFDFLYFIVDGSVTVSVRTQQGERVRLRSMGPGSCVGEISMYLGINATARVEAETATETIALSKSDLGRMRDEAPDLFARLHEALAHALAARLADSTRLIDILMH